MFRKGTLGAAALLVALAPAVGAQQPADPMAGMRAQMDSMHEMMQDMHHMMMSMHGQGGMMMGMQGQAGSMTGGMQGGMTPDGHDAPSPPAMGGMGMMGTPHSPGASADAGCPATGPDAGLSALLDRSVATLQLTEAQRSDLQGVLESARAEALAKLTPEQRARLELIAPTGGGACAAAPAAANPHH
jgi:hypothetical protein